MIITQATSEACWALPSLIQISKCLFQQRGDTGVHLHKQSQVSRGDVVMSSDILFLACPLFWESPWGCESEGLHVMSLH